MEKFEAKRGGNRLSLRAGTRDRAGAALPAAAGAVHGVSRADAAPGSNQLQACPGFQDVHAPVWRTPHRRRRRAVLRGHGQMYWEAVCRVTSRVQYILECSVYCGGSMPHRLGNVYTPSGIFFVFAPLSGAGASGPAQGGASGARPGPVEGEAGKTALPPPLGVKPHSSGLLENPSSLVIPPPIKPTPLPPLTGGYKKAMRPDGYRGFAFARSPRGTFFVSRAAGFWFFLPPCQGG